VTADGTLPDDLRAWIEREAGGGVTSARRHLVGASRKAWAVDVGRDGGVMESFVLQDTGRGGGSRRDAQVLRALAGTAVPVPAVHAHDPELGALLLARVEGRSDFPAVDDEAEREPTARHLMELTAALHALAPEDLPIEHLGAPPLAPEHAHTQLAAVEGVAEMLGDHLHPLFAITLVWLRHQLPLGRSSTSLVHSDMGPGNFLAAGGRVTAVLDWEVAHWGDPMEDLAAVAVRDMATPMGHLPTRFAEYGAAGGEPVDTTVVGWYRILILTRNALFIGLGLGGDDPAVDRAQLTMYRVMLMRAAALALCDAIGVARPSVEPFAAHDEPGPATFALADLVGHARRDQDEAVRPALEDPFAEGRASGVAGVLGTVEQHLSHGAERDRRECELLAGVLGQRPVSAAGGLAALVLDAHTHVHPDNPAFAGQVASVLAVHMLHEGLLAAPLLGELADRVPQRLDAS
jgi:aminoglycoside phosphotransferase (APT) family kinase protein